MSTEVRTRLQSMKAAPMKHENEKQDMQGSKINDASKATRSQGASRKERKTALQQDVDKLKKKLRHEENIHRALERAFSRPLGALPRLPPYLPTYTLELLAEVAVLEEEVVRLEQEVLHFRQDLYQEAVYISSSKRSGENSIDSYAQYPIHNYKPERHKFSALNGGDSSVCTRRHRPSLSDGRGKEYKWCQNSTKNQKGSPIHKSQTIKTPVKRPLISQRSAEKHLDPQNLQCSNFQVECRLKDQASLESRTPDEKPSRDDGPNRISEDILKCLLSILLRMGSKKNHNSAENFPYLLTLGTRESSEEKNYRDPYGICSEYGKRDIGPYHKLCHIEASSINPNRSASSLFLLRRLKLLLGKLASVNLESLTHQEKLAFWINMYNSCMMNAFLEHGIPESPEGVAALMQKATINVGGHLLNAVTIEHSILRLPFHSKYVHQTSLEGTKNAGKTWRSIVGLEFSEPLVTFALSCGSWSSPAVRVYTASQVENELEVAKREYLQAAVGISTTKFAIPKLLDWYLLDFAKDLDSFLDWICLQLPCELAKEAINCLERGKKEPPHSQFVQVMPYDFSFRYLLYSE
ncbi:hypothetical protein F2P56_034080 [Juglans regia]|uniref:Uncharacterized protein LOC108992363 isoform X2 n=2 Tax=Juglans regia TaxID=51240 RepID=A0A2I4ESU2_JUGRE|nr:uncharacterized protein LOC108992363 isoform X2 [Juglans regia]KAF5444993.1 hypothetical protein F2P56_034080 [Juglans regia]